MKNAKVRKMGFVIEEVDEAGEKFLQSLNLSSPFCSSNKASFDEKWAIDRERNAILTGIGGIGISPEQPEYLLFYYKEHSFSIYEYREKYEYKTEQCDLTFDTIYHIVALYMNKKFEEEKQEIKKLMEEAMTVWCTRFNQYGFKLSNKVEFKYLNIGN